MSKPAGNGLADYWLGLYMDKIIETTKELTPMKTYRVELDERIKHVIEIEADTKEQALSMAYEAVMNGPEDQYNTDSEGIIASYVYEEN